MKVMIISGVFAKENEQEIIEHAKRPVEFSANVFQNKMIRGFQKTGIETSVLSAPFIGSFPNASGIIKFSGFTNYQDQYTYVPFNNCWGFRNMSRAASLKKALENFIADVEQEKLIVVYSAHTPFLEAAVYAKKRNPKIRICMVIPDLPQYMNLNTKISMIYKLGKQWDIAKFNKLAQFVDSFVLLTEAMKEKLPVGNKPYKVVEGIVDDGAFEKNEIARKQLRNCGSKEQYIVYTGKTNERFGVRKLVDAFTAMEAPSARLVLCGRGDCDAYIAEMALRDNRIVALGQVPHDVAAQWVLKADVLVNPRENTEEYTKYSFPSKTIEYLASGNPTVGYMLDGMPDIYQQLLFIADGDGLAETIKKALNVTAEERQFRSAQAKEYLDTLCAKSLAEKILQITYAQ